MSIGLILWINFFSDGFVAVPAENEFIRLDLSGEFINMSQKPKDYLCRIPPVCEALTECELVDICKIVAIHNYYDLIHLHPLFSKPACFKMTPPTFDMIFLGKYCETNLIVSLLSSVTSNPFLIANFQTLFTVLTNSILSRTSFQILCILKVFLVRSSCGYSSLNNVKKSLISGLS